MPRFLKRCTATLVAGALLAMTGCTAQPTTATSSVVTAASSSTAPGSPAPGASGSAGPAAPPGGTGTPTGAAPTGTGTGAGAAATGASGTGAPTAAQPAPGNGSGSATATGDGRWHPQVDAGGGNGPVPILVQRLLADQPVTDVRAGSLSILDRRSYLVSVGTACGPLLTALATAAKSAGLTVVAAGSVRASALAPAAWWLVVGNGPADGANLSLTSSSSGTKACDIAGVPFTPVHLTLTGPVKAEVASYTAVTCGPVASGESLAIWGFPVSGSKPTATLTALVSATGPGTHRLGEDDLAYLTTSPLYTMDQSLAVDDLATGLPPGATQLTGTVTLAAGLASGSLDLAGGGEHLTGTFACGTPIVTG